MKKKLGRIPLPNKPPKIIQSKKQRYLNDILEQETLEEMDRATKRGKITR